MNTSEQLDKLAPALAKAQAEMGGAVKEANNPFFKSKYADLTSVWKACKEALHNNGLSVIQSPVSAPEGRIGVATMLLHSSGQFVSGEYTLGVKKDNDPQADGSSLTYARRYALAAFVGVCPVDDDGEAAMMREKAAVAKNNEKAAKGKQSLDQGNIDGWVAVGVAAIMKDSTPAEWWAKFKERVIADCGVEGAKVVHRKVVK
jgi:hypothetical protein